VRTYGKGGQAEDDNTAQAHYMIDI